MVYCHWKMSLENLFAYTVLLTGLVRGTLKPSAVEAQDPITILEGGNIDIFCNSSGHVGYNVFWESSDKLFRLDGNELLISDISRNQSGLYTCYATKETSLDVIQNVVIEVLCPAKILSWSSPYRRLRPNGTYDMLVEIEGQPPPDRILLISDTTGNILYRGEGGGVKNITIESVQCGDTGTYHLRVVNDFNSASLQRNITVYCIPYVNTSVTTTFDTMPRLGETTILEMHAAGFPQPNFTWTRNGSNIQHSDNGYTSKVTLENIDVNDFGAYQLDMENSVGKSSYTFHVIPSGPPEPPSNLTYLQSTSYSATISWVSGYDYNETQTFVIIDYVDEEYKVLHEFTDALGSYGNQIIKTIDKLKSAHHYNITIEARNRNGTSGYSVKSITFNTTKSSPPIGVIVGILLSPVIVVLVCSFAIRQSSKWKRRNKYTLTKADEDEKRHLIPRSTEKINKNKCSNYQGENAENGEIEDLLYRTQGEIEDLLYRTREQKDTFYSNTDQVDGYVAP